MAELFALPDRARAQREASEWIARLAADDVSAADRADFESWREANPRNRRAHEELTATWQRFANAGRIVRAVSLGNSLGEVGTTRAAPRRWLFASAAALVVVALMAALWMKTLHPVTRFQTALGEHASIRLPDGSSLELNSHSRARMEFSEASRVVVLEQGEAYFKVAHETSRPFWVVAAGSWVRAVGTEFNVDLRRDAVRVTVREGTIKVATALGGEGPSDERLAQAAASFVYAGQQAEMQGVTTQIRALAPAGLARSINWRTGVLSFANEPLAKVVDELSRYTALDIEIDDAALREIPVGGTFEASPAGAEALLTMLQDGFGLEVRRASEGRVFVHAAADSGVSH